MKSWNPIDFQITFLSVALFDVPQALRQRRRLWAVPPPPPLPSPLSSVPHPHRKSFPISPSFHFSLSILILLPLRLPLSLLVSLPPVPSLSSGRSAGRSLYYATRYRARPFVISISGKDFKTPVPEKQRKLLNFIVF